MKTKLILSINENVLHSAKVYTQKSGTNLSSLVEDYFKKISRGEENNPAISPRVRSFMGVIKLESDFDYKKVVSKAICKKYQ